MINNAGYDIVYNQFEKRRYHAENENDKRVNEVLQKVEGFRQLSEQGADLSVQYALHSLLPDEESSNHHAFDLKGELAWLETKKAELLTQYGYPKDYLKVRYQCLKCNDTGYIAGEKCKCLQKALIEYEYSQSNLSQFICDNNFDVLRKDLQSGKDLELFLAAVDISVEFCEKFQKEYKNLMFSGSVGTGKSFLSGCIAKNLLDKGYCVVYFSAVRLFDTLGSRLFKRVDSQNAEGVDFLRESDLLIIDDLGTEITNDFTNSRLFECINERFLLKKPIIISTNLAPAQIHSRYTDRISSRLFSQFIMCKFTGTDVRRAGFHK